MSRAGVQHIVLLNGWSVPSALWAPFFETDFEHCTIQIIDLSRECSAEEYCQLIDQSIKPSSLLIGWSLGGALATYYVSQFESEKLHKGWVKGMVVLQTSPCFVSCHDWSAGVLDNDFSALRELVSEHDAAKLIRRFSHLLLAGSVYRKQDRQFLNARYSIETLPSFESLACGLELLNTLDLRAHISKIVMPVLWFFGGGDSLISKATIENVRMILLKAGCHKQTLSVVEGMGHFPCGEHGLELKNALTGFMDTL